MKEEIIYSHGPLDLGVDKPKGIRVLDIFLRTVYLLRIIYKQLNYFTIVIKM